MKTYLPLIFSFFFILSCNINISPSIKGNREIVTEVRNIGNEFHSIEVLGPFDVIIEDGIAPGEVKITGESNILEYVDVSIENSTLTVTRTKNMSFMMRKPITVHATAKNLNSVSIIGSGDININTAQHTEEFTASIKGSGDVKANIQSSSVIAQISGSGDIYLKGGTDSLKAEIKGSGDINAFDLASGNTEVNISGSGDVSVSVFGKLNGNIKGSGDIRYKGAVTEQNIKVSGSGSVKKAD